MIRVETPRDQVNVAKVYETGQEQIFEYWDNLNSDERRMLLAQLGTVDFQEFHRMVRSLQERTTDGLSSGPGKLDPIDMIPLPSTEKQRQERQLAERVGWECLRRGECAVLMVAGGQGTRLRAEGPKGCYPIGPVTGRSLFRFHAEQLLSVQRQLKRSLPWYIMTSESNHEQTRSYFQEHGNFGLNPADVIFQPQGMLPVVDRRRGKILLESRHTIALSPNGHGGAIGMLRSLQEDLGRRGVKNVFTHQVDNPLLRVCDPVFLGYHLLSESQFSSKAVAKAHAEERMGVFCRARSGPLVVEYTELGDRERLAVDEHGQLRFRAGNVAAHIVSTELLSPSDGSEPFVMPYHRAHKAAAHIVDGELVVPEEPNAIKFESFLFDVLPYSRNPVVFEISRDDEFAPVKNADGDDSPATCRRAFIERWGRWLEFAGVTVPRNAQHQVGVQLEIGPLAATTAMELKSRLEGQDVTIQDGWVLE